MSFDLTRPADLPDLAFLSARLGGDPLLIQAAGGNTSVKVGEVMWIKASGTQLSEADSRNIFVPVDVADMRAAMEDPERDADQTQAFLLGDQTLRPSIETSLHAVFEQRVVLHVHCVQTLAGAIRRDARAYFAECLQGFDWCLAPYAKPGAELAQSVRGQMSAKTDVVILQNHGLLVAGPDVAGAEALLNRVVAALTVAPGPVHRPDMAGLQALAGEGWSVPEAQAPVHQLAFDPVRCAQAVSGSLYPDHVIFCGVAARILTGKPTKPETETPMILIVPDKGSLIRADATAGGQALARCLADVLMRVPGDADLTMLTGAQNAELLNWDAETYRKSLDA